jgi:putative mRNA 3-end processing factor
VRLAYQGEIWVISGDYKLEIDGLSTPFEPVKCHTFITECTFGLPVFHWQKQEIILNEINDWWKLNAAQGFNSVLFAYALGKGQRILHGLDRNIGEIWLHGAIYQSNEALRRSKVPIADFPLLTKEIKKEQVNGAIIIAPPSAMGTPWLRRFSPYRTGLASGWMSMRGNRRRRSIDRGFVMSDHADWYGLNEAIRATEAETVWATHGYTAPFVKWLQDQGLEAHELNTEFQGELAEMQEESIEEATPPAI